MRRRGSFELLVVAGLLVGACAAAPLSARADAPAGKSLGAITVPGVPVYYYSGDTRIDLVVALDELHVKDGTVASGTVIARSAAEADALDAGLKAKATSAGGDGNEYFLRLEANPNVSSLEENASALATGRFGVRQVRAVAYSSEDSARELSDKRIITNEFAVKLTGGQDIEALAKKYGATVREKVSYSPDTYILATDGAELLSALNAANAIRETEPGIAFATPQVAKIQVPRFVPNDPLYSTQWHLKNTAQVSGAVAGNDVNVEGAWDTVTGAGVNIAITDDGVQTTHPDLSAACRTDIDRDVFSGDNDPSPVIANGDEHGNSCAGVAAARGNNSVGVSGSARGASIVGVRLTAGAVTDSQEATAMGWQVSPSNAADRVSINSNSWGPADTGTVLDTFGPLTKAAFENAIVNGRGGRGTIFTWAAGNGRCSNDNICLDGYASSRYTIAVGASGADGKYSFYSEPGSTMLINAPSNYGSCGSGVTAGITTTDLTGTNGYNTASGTSGDYTNNTGAIGFGGTSSATPLAAGCIALMLEANPNLGWRDVQGILIDSTTLNDNGDGGWVQNGSGRFYNPSYGFGRVNASNAVALASTWVNYGPENLITSTAVPNLAIPDFNVTGVSSTININAPSNFVVEHVEVVFNATHTWRGDIRAVLTGPSGISSLMMQQRGGDSTDNYVNQLATTVAHWGENATGNWRLTLSDSFAQDTGTFDSWQLKIYGHLTESITPAETNIYGPGNDFGGWEMSALGLLAVLPQGTGGTNYLQYPSGGSVGNFTGLTTTPVLSFPTANTGTPDPFDVTPAANRFASAGTTSLSLNAAGNAIGFLRFSKVVNATIPANALVRFRVGLQSDDLGPLSKDDFKFGMGNLKTGVTNEFYSANTAKAFAALHDPAGADIRFFNPVPFPGSEFDSYLISEVADTSIPIFVDLQPTDGVAAATGNDIRLKSWELSTFDLGANRSNLSGKSVKINRGAGMLPTLAAGEVLFPEPGASDFTFGPSSPGANAPGQVTGVGASDNSSLTQAMLNLSGSATALSYNFNGPLVPNGAITYYPDYRSFSFYSETAWLDIDHPTGGHFRGTNNKMYITDVWASTPTPSSTNLPQLRLSTNFGYLDFNITNHFIQAFGGLNPGVEIQSAPRAYSAVNKMQVGPSFTTVPAFVTIEFLQPSLPTMNTNAYVTIHRITVTEFNAP